MTFLSHSIPWQSLSRLFEYRGAKSGPGPQEPHLHTEEKPAHRKQLEHFAIHFQKTVREHSIIERGRYSTAQAYRDRAATWKTSSLGEPHVRANDAKGRNAGHESDEPEATGTLDVSSNTGTTASSIETRRVYPSYFSTTYMSFVPQTSGGAYGRKGLLESLADIAAWIDYYARYNRYWAWIDSDPDNTVSSDEETYNALWLDVKSCSDVLRLLVIDAATVSDDSQRKNRISTLLLLANHPEVGLDGFLSDAMVFIFLNLLLALVEDDEHGKSLRPWDHLEDFKRQRGRKPLVHLLPRPAYMNMRAYFRMFEQVLDEHGHAVEHVLFGPFFAPRPSGRRSSHLKFDGESLSESNEARLERDVMEDRQSLHEALKQMWKVLVFCDMVFRETGKHINWEYVSLNAINELFLESTSKLVGYDYWSDYAYERNEAGSFEFYADSGKDRSIS